MAKMRLVDVNILVTAFRADTTGHEPVRAWLEHELASPTPYAVSDHVLAGFLRVATHPRVFDPPTPSSLALDFADAYRRRPTAVPIAPGERHWSIFRNLCREVGSIGNLVPDTWLAALAIEHGCEFITLDADFARFPGLRWRRPV
ncbi:MAG: type II toxin-antitoxin system VapC family toxin [Gemmatimonadales bacterium]|nr:type II toxin-antitoxin system VapC family toxin [Gemmatimonadales bacterium]MDZ4390810.1 type II toxin-antitoxin system VapC family toxin [Gemmatimonadales bacterium]